MVASLRALILAALFLPLPLACNVDLAGLVASGEVNTRLESKDTFHFLSGADRNLPLADEYSFIVLTDTHIQRGDAHGLEKLRDVLNGAAEDNVSFVVITGDITQNGRREDLEKFIEIAAALGLPCYPVIGNHDIYFDNFSNWKDLIGSTRYRIDHRNTTLFILDSANATFGASQLDWLNAELRTAGEHAFVFTHTNLFVETPGDIQQIADVRERARVLSILKGRVDAMFMGHVHRRIIREAGGVQYITIEDFIGHGTYCRVYVSGEGIRYEFAHRPLARPLGDRVYLAP